MKNLPILLLIGFLIGGCSAGPLEVGSAAKAATPGATSLSKPMAVTANPPLIPIGPVQGNPANHAPTPTPFLPEGWKTFADAARGAAIDYPSDWSVVQQADEVVFTSPLGATILLQAALGDGPGHGTEVPGLECNTLINSNGLSVEACVDTVADRYTATYELKSADDSTQRLTLSTGQREALDVYKVMLNSLRQLH